MSSSQSSRDRDLDRRTLEKLRSDEPTWREIPNERLRKTYQYAWMRFGLACRDLTVAIRAEGDRMFRRRR